LLEILRDVVPGSALLAHWREVVDVELKSATVNVENISVDCSVGRLKKKVLQQF
jgi:hypothetical protein